MKSIQYRSGSIYSNIIEKRLDNASYDMEYELQKASIYDSSLCFERENGLEEALKEGIFMLRIPSFINLNECDRFAQTFYTNKSNVKNNIENYNIFRNYTSDIFKDPLLGFHQRVDQIEQFLLEKRFWDEWYPQPIRKVAYQLCDVSALVIKTILEKIGMSIKDYYVATGGCSEKEGSYHLTFNHYRPSIDKKGLSSHKDDGFVTILRTVSPGLEVNRYNKWEKVKTDREYFIINFGLSMEILTKNSSCPVSAIMHRVTQQENDRWSWGHFSSSQCTFGSDHGIYEYSNKSGLTKICDSRELINNNDYEIYFGTNIKNNKRTPHDQT